MAMPSPARSAIWMRCRSRIRALFAAQRLERGDGGLLGLQIGAHRPRDAQPARQERGKADEAEEIFKTLDQGAHPGRGVVSVAHAQAVLTEPGAQGLADIAGILAPGQGDARRRRDPHARIQQAGLPDGVQTGQDTKAELEAPAQPVGLCPEHGGGDERLVARLESVTQFQIELVEHPLLDRRSGQTVHRGKSLGDGHGLAVGPGQLHGSGQGIEPIHAAQIGQTTQAGRRLSHDIDPRRVADLAQLF